MVTAGNTYHTHVLPHCECLQKGVGGIPLKALRLAHFSSLWAEAERHSDIFMTCGGWGCVLRRAGGVKPQECSGRFSGSSRRFPAAARAPLKEALVGILRSHISRVCLCERVGCVQPNSARLDVKQSLMHVLAAAKNTFL